MRLTHLGHACLLVETGGARLLIDPGTMSAFDAVRDLDAVLVTHQHPDHVDNARLPALLAANPLATLRSDFAAHDRFTVGGATVEAFGGLHAAVYGDVPGCTNTAYLIDGLLHPGDAFVVPDRDIDILAVPIDGPWLKLSEAVDYVHRVAPRVAIPIHEAETTDPAKYTGMLAAFSPPGVVQILPLGAEVTL
jgi:L-ascorbate metabolism protein UlaG (beta-lactamase superfamily)